MGAGSTVPRRSWSKGCLLVRVTVLERLDSWTFPGQRDEVGAQHQTFQGARGVFHHIQGRPDYQDALTWDAGEGTIGKGPRFTSVSSQHNARSRLLARVSICLVWQPLQVVWRWWQWAILVTGTRRDKSIVSSAQVKSRSQNKVLRPWECEIQPLSGGLAGRQQDCGRHTGSPYSLPPQNTRASLYYLTGIFRAKEHLLSPLLTPLTRGLGHTEKYTFTLWHFCLVPYIFKNPFLVFFSLWLQT